MATQTNRTRSQTTLDAFLLKPNQLDGSPYKLARNAVRNNLSASTSESIHSESMKNTESDDELLLSPKKARTKKRSSSSLEHEDAGGPSDERKRKRAKREENNQEDGSSLPPPNAASSDAPPNQATPHRSPINHTDVYPKVFPSPPRPAGPFDFSVLSPRRSTPSSSPSSTTTPARRRAISVPPSSSPLIPLLNLKELLSSPKRQPSTSPTKPQLRFTSMPRVLGNSGDQMQIDGDGDADLSAPITALNLVEEFATPHPLIHPTRIQTSQHVPLWTPSACNSSPLTPLPPTPAPFKTPIASMISAIVTPDPAPTDSSTPRVAVEGSENEATPKASDPFATRFPDDTGDLDKSMSHEDEEFAPSVRESAALSKDLFSPQTTTVIPDAIPAASSSGLIPSESRPSEHTLSSEALASSPAGPTPSLLPLSRLPRPSTRRKLSDSSLSSVPPSDTDDPPPARPVQNPRPVVTARARGRGRGRGLGVGRAAGVPPRLTRSASLKQKQKLMQKDVGGNSGFGAAQTSTLSNLFSSLKAKSGPTTDASTSRSTTPASTVPTAKTFQFSYAAPTTSSQIKALEKSPSKKPVSLPKLLYSKAPSPVKPASSIGAGWKQQSSKHSSLSSLSLALEKLKVPAPSRPVMSLGFNAAVTANSDEAGPSTASAQVKDDSTVGLATATAGSSKLVGPSGLKRASTVTSIGSMPSTFGSRPFAAFAPPPAKPPTAGPSKINLGSGVVAGRKNIFGTVRSFDKVSKKSSLPMVEGSPVKGGHANGRQDEMLERTERATTSTDGTASELGNTRIPAVEPMDLSAAVLISDSGAVAGTDSPKPLVRKRDDSRRASAASHLLSQALADLPQTPSPKKPSSSKSRASETGRSSSPTARSKSLRSASGGQALASRSAPGALNKGGGVGAHVAAGSGASGSGSGSGKKKAVALKVLKSCTIFVDVRTDDGEDAGSLFVDMLRGLGARILGSAGSTCTHIVYKNGLMSTLTKYRLMPDSKPLVVGIAWVVECAEQRARVDESKFLVDLEFANVAGTNKRRRSMLPKHIYSAPRTPPPGSMGPPPVPLGSNGTSAGDQSIESRSSGIVADGDDASNSSLLFDDDDDLPPLERARKRRNLMLGR